MASFEIIEEDLKVVLAHETGLEPKGQGLFRGKERGDDECLHMVVK